MNKNPFDENSYARMKTATQPENLHFPEQDETGTITRDSKAALTTRLSAEHMLQYEHIAESLQEELEKGEVYRFQVKKREDIPSHYSGTPFHFYQAEGLQVHYPDSVKEALALLHNEFCERFTSLVEQSKETSECYAYAKDAEGKTNIPFVQIDMPLLPQSFLKKAENIAPMVLAEVLRKYIFEFESSVAHYNLISEINDGNGFKNGFREHLDRIRETSGKKIILLAVTDSKAKSIKELEFGIKEETPDAREVYEKSGFDGLWGPSDVKKYYHDKTTDDSEYVFFTRASADVQKLRGKSVEEENILENDELRRFIKQHSLTINIDEPGVDLPVNDTKEYMQAMGMGVFFNDIKELYSDEANKAREENKLATFDGQVVSKKLESYLRACGISKEDIVSGNFSLRCKPVSEFYGAYGHHTIKDLRASTKKLKTDLKKNGKYILQIERPTVEIYNPENEEYYKGIHRIFMARDPKTGTVSFLEGMINMLPSEHSESKKGNIHGNNSAIWGEIN